MRPRPLALALACLTSSTLAFAAEPSAPSAAPRAGASEPESGFADRFFRGTSPGHLPAEKALVIGTLYVGSLTSVGFGIASLLHAGSQSDDADAFKLEFATQGK